MLQRTSNRLSNQHVPRWLMPAAQPFTVRLVVAILFGVAISLSAWRVQSVLHVPPASPEEHQGLTDFHNSVYFPAIGFREGFNPYSREYVEHYPTYRLPPYSPAMFWLLYPFSLLPVPAADVAYFAFSCGLVVAFAASALAVCRVPLTLANVLGLSTLILFSRPGHINVLLGQVTLIVVLGAIWALDLAKHRPALGGIALAVTTLKPTFGVPIMCLMLCRGNFRTVAVGAVIGGLAAAVGLIPIVMNHGFLSVVESIRQSEAHLAADSMVAIASTWTRIDCTALIGKLLDYEPDLVTQVAVFAVTLALAGIAVWAISSASRAGADHLSALIICAATLACVYHSTYCALLLVGPWVAVSAGRLRDQVPARLSVIVWLLLTIPAVNYFSSRVFMSSLGVKDPLASLLTVVNSASIAAVLFLSTGAALRSWFVDRANSRQGIASPTRLSGRVR